MILWSGLPKNQKLKARLLQEQQERRGVDAGSPHPGGGAAAPSNAAFAAPRGDSPARADGSLERNCTFFPKPFRVLPVS